MPYMLWLERVRQTDTIRKTQMEMVKWNVEIKHIYQLNPQRYFKSCYYFEACYIHFANNNIICKIIFM